MDLIRVWLKRMNRWIQMFTYAVRFVEHLFLQHNTPTAWCCHRRTSQLGWCSQAWKLSCLFFLRKYWRTLWWRGSKTRGHMPKTKVSVHCNLCFCCFVSSECPFSSCCPGMVSPRTKTLQLLFWGWSTHFTHRSCLLPELSGRSHGVYTHVEMFEPSAIWELDPKMNPSSGGRRLSSWYLSRFFLISHDATQK